MTPPCPPARLAAIEAIRDLLTRVEYAYDPDTAIEHLSGVPNAIRVLTTALNGERETTPYVIGVDHGNGPDASVVTVWDTSTDPPTRVGAPPTNCDSCAHDYRTRDGNPGCNLIDTEEHEEVVAWGNDNLTRNGSVITGATGCPGWKAREMPAEVPIAELVERLGLVRLIDEDDETAEWRAADGQLWVWEGSSCWYADLTCKWGPGTEFPTEDAALRAYARAKGVA